MLIIWILSKGDIVKHIPSSCTFRCFHIVHVKNRVYYEYYHLDGTQEVPADYKEISFVCLRPDGSLELPSTLGIVCRSVAKKLERFPFSPVASHLYQQPAFQWGCSERCTGAVRTLRCQYHNEYLRSLNKKSKTEFRKTS